VKIKRDNWGEPDDPRWKEMQQELQQHDYPLLISVAEKYDVPLDDVVPLFAHAVMREQPLTEGEVLGISALTVSRLAHARENYQYEHVSRGRLPNATEIVCGIWPVYNDDDAGLY
jgi:hypothetical protein